MEIVAVNRRATASGFLCIAAMAWAVVSFAGGFTLRVDGAAKSVRFPLSSNVFGLSWVHSVERTEWRETYTVGPGGEILLTASTFESAGAGLPERLGDGEFFRLEGGTMRIEGRRVPIGDLRVRLSDVSPHLLHVGERAVDLNSVFGEGVVTIRVEEEPPRKGGCR
ncbi:MAG: DUF1850 domain-containing protein [Deltaproteobacteria bacterium]|nr:DUF1850 domain-containing protein [Deltaproteobacteria bacterium]